MWQNIYMRCSVPNYLFENYLRSRWKDKIETNFVKQGRGQSFASAVEPTKMRVGNNRKEICKNSNQIYYIILVQTTVSLILFQFHHTIVFYFVFVQNPCIELYIYVVVCDRMYKMGKHLSKMQISFLFLIWLIAHWK